jgi:hypothetical protein
LPWPHCISVFRTFGPEILIISFMLLRCAFLLLLLHPTLPALAQPAVQNVTGAQAGDNVLVTYDLVDQSGKAFYVRLLVSKDGGISFSNELRNVSGDVKANVKAGANRKIIWDAKQELGAFAGDVVFKVEALAPGAAASGFTAQNRCLKVELIEIKNHGPGRVRVDYTVTPINGNSTVYLSAFVSNTYLADANNNRFKISEGFLAGTPKGQDKAVLNGVPYSGYAVFEGVPAGLQTAAQLSLFVGAQGFQSGACAQNDANAAFRFNNVPIEQ